MPQILLVPFFSGHGVELAWSHTKKGTALPNKHCSGHCKTTDKKYLEKEM